MMSDKQGVNDKAKKISIGFHRLGLLLATLSFVIHFFSKFQDYGPDLYLIVTSLILAGFAYGITRFIGWVINGFIKG